MRTPTLLLSKKNNWKFPLIFFVVKPSSQRQRIVQKLRVIDDSELAEFGSSEFRIKTMDIFLSPKTISVRPCPFLTYIKTNV